MDFIHSFFSNALSGISNLLVYAGIVALFVVGLIRCIAPVVHTRHAAAGGAQHPLGGRQVRLAAGRLPGQGHAVSPLERIPEQPVLRRRRVPQRQQRGGLHQRGDRDVRPGPRVLRRRPAGADDLAGLPGHADRPGPGPVRLQHDRFRRRAAVHRHADPRHALCLHHVHLRRGGQRAVHADHPRGVRLQRAHAEVLLRGHEPPRRRAERGPDDPDRHLPAGADRPDPDHGQGPERRLHREHGRRRARGRGAAEPVLQELRERLHQGADALHGRGDAALRRPAGRIHAHEAAALRRGAGRDQPPAAGELRGGAGQPGRGQGRPGGPAADAAPLPGDPGPAWRAMPSSWRTPASRPTTPTCAWPAPWSRWSWSPASRTTT